jgi:hypothetical protein
MLAAIRRIISHSSNSVSPRSRTALATVGIVKWRETGGVWQLMIERWAGQAEEKIRRSPQRWPYGLLWFITELLVTVLAVLVAASNCHDERRSWLDFVNLRVLVSILTWNTTSTDSIRVAREHTLCEPTQSGRQ